MAERVTTELTTATAGVGKSYTIVDWIVNKFIPDMSGTLITNMDLGEVPKTHSTPPAREGETFVDRIAEYCEKKYGSPADKTRERIRLLDRESLAKWRTQKVDVLDDEGEVIDREISEPSSGPWDMFAGEDLTDCYFVLDEAHNFASSHHDKSHLQDWQEWCGELRHQKASVHFLTQNLTKLAKTIIDEAGKRYALVPNADEFGPYVKIRNGMWYELRAKITGKYRASILKYEYQDRGGKKKRDRSKDQIIQRKPEVFALYDSYAAPIAGGAGGGAAKIHEYERLSTLEFYLWWITETWGAWIKPLFIIIVAVLLYFNHGTLFGRFQRIIRDGTGMRPKATMAENIGEVVQVETVRETYAGLPVVQTQELASGERIVQMTPDYAVIGKKVVRVGDIVSAAGPNKLLNAIDYEQREVVIGNAKGGERYALGEYVADVAEEVDSALYGDSILERSQ